MSSGPAKRRSCSARAVRRSSSLVKRRVPRSSACSAAGCIFSFLSASAKIGPRTARITRRLDSIARTEFRTMADAPSLGNQTMEIPPIGVRLGSRLWAGFLSLAYPGLGQAFRGNYRRGIWFGIGGLAAFFVFTRSVQAWPVLPSGLLFILVVPLSGILIFAVACWAAIDAFRLGRYGASRLPRWWLRFLVYAGFILVLESRDLPVPHTHWEPFSIPSASMEPTTLVGDYILAINGYYETHQPRRGELAVFALPSDTSVDFFKRVVGLPGDHIQMKSGVLFVNDMPVRRDAVGPYIFTASSHPQTEYRETLSSGASYLVALE